MELIKNKQKVLYALCVIGIAISLYLTYTKVTSSSIACINAGCNTVQASKYSELFGIPVGVFGFGFYFVLFTLIFKNNFAFSKILLIWGNLYSLYLLYLELFVIKAICVWCVGSFVVIILLSILVFMSKEEQQSETAQ